MVCDTAGATIEISFTVLSTHTRGSDIGDSISPVKSIAGSRYTRGGYALPHNPRWANTCNYLNSPALTQSVCMWSQ